MSFLVAVASMDLDETPFSVFGLNLSVIVYDDEDVDVVTVELRHTPTRLETGRCSNFFTTTLFLGSLAE